MMLIIFNGFKPLHHECGVFPLVGCGSSRDFVVDSIKDFFAAFAYLKFSGVD